MILPTVPDFEAAVAPTPAPVAPPAPTPATPPKPSLADFNGVLALILAAILVWPHLPRLHLPRFHVLCSPHCACHAAPPTPPPPGPSPAPTVGPARVTLVYDTSDTAAMQALAPTLADATLKGQLAALGVPVFRHYDKDSPTLASDGLGRLAGAIGLPALVVQPENGSKATVIKSPTTSEGILQAVAKVVGK